MNSPPLADHSHRQQALDIRGSYIVQAPAGSGKTELLTLRFLKLLAVSAQPEQVLAITFTKKAANEMGKRIIEALHWAQACLAKNHKPRSSLEQQRLDIARDVLAQNHKHNWHLLQNPARLRVQTIDSFCFYLARQLPVLSQLGGNPRVSDDVSICFKDAIHNTLQQLESNQAISDDIAALLTHLDNDVSKIERLLLHLLYKRDQWLSHIVNIKKSPDDAQAYLQQNLEELVSESLAFASAALQSHEAALLPLLNFSAENQQRAGTLAAASWVPHITLPAPEFAAIPYWLFIADSLLTRKSEWRRTVTVKNGFPASDKSGKERTAECKANKAAMLELLETLQADDDLLALLDYLRLLPDPALNPASWQFLAALTRVLAHLSTELLLSFGKFHVIDYAQTSAAARTALGEEEAPTDLALALDNNIQHVLVDEFQDTSQMQLEILQQLTAGWEPEDGRSLFLVGDAMQSCYAFRNANVGIYLNVRANGLGNIPLTPLTLETNFRSTQTVIAWVNNTFSRAFPRHPNPSRGAVPYTASVAVHPQLDDMQVCVELITHDKAEAEQARQAEAIRVVATVKQIQQHYPQHSIAILVRARPHLNPIISTLRDAGIQWQSSDIDRLDSLPIISDLLSLTCAIINQADRLAWLAILRAPWCGLPVNDLHAVSLHAGENSIWSALQDLAHIEHLSEDGRARLQAPVAALQYAMHSRLQINLRSVVASCWQLLGGTGISKDPVELGSVARFLDLLGEHESGMSLTDIDQFKERVAAAFVPNRTASDNTDLAPIHLLTMHKAKGLEFDHVILPGLARSPMSDDKPLLQWHERLNSQGQSRMFLATLAAPGSDDEALYELLRYEQRYKGLLENTRLLYIAVTRARYSVYLYATTALNSKAEIEPPKSSLLSRIWRQLKDQPETVQETPLSSVNQLAFEGDTSAAEVNYAPASSTPIRRVQHPLQLSPEQLEYVQRSGAKVDTATILNFSLDEEAKIGTLIHRALESLGRTAPSGAKPYMEPAQLKSMRHYWRLQLRSLTASDKLLEQYVQQVEHGVTNTLNSPSLHWLYDNTLQEDSYEAALSRKQNGYSRRYRIDRSIVDATGTRWIIDYKTSTPQQGQDEDDFIEAQLALYAEQLQNYRSLYQALEQRPGKCAILFTALGKLVELPAN